MTGGELNRRIVRRETTSSRAIASVIAAVLVSLACLYAMLETALKALGEEEWLLAPETVGAWIRDLPSGIQPLLLGAAGAVLFIVGLLFFLQGVLPGRRARHVIPNPRAAVVVDAEVVASSLARRARMIAGVTPEQVLVTVSRRLVEVQLRPTSGFPVSPERVQAAVEDELRRTFVDPMPQVRVRIAGSGVIGQ
jgi:hypothetical protein